MKKYPTEGVTWEEACLRHPDHYIDAARIVDNGEERFVIFVWRSLEVSDKEDPVAVYWRVEMGCREDPDIESGRSLAGPFLIVGSLLYLAYVLARVALELFGVTPPWGPPS